jgi:hypothetical protein
MKPAAMRGGATERPNPLFLHGRVKQHDSQISLLNIGLLCRCTLLVPSVRAQEKQPTALKPVTVCEILENLKQFEGQPVAMVGRFSFRSGGRWMSEDECGAPNGDARPPEHALIWLAYEPQSAPRAAGGYQMDSAAIEQKLQRIKKHTSLKQFRFGTPDYDRWAVVYGEIRAPEPEKAAPHAHPDAPAELVYAGDGYVLFLRDTGPSRTVSR